MKLIHRVSQLFEAVLFQFHFNMWTVLMSSIPLCSRPDLTGWRPGTWPSISWFTGSCLGSRYQVNRWETVKRMHFLILNEKALLSVIILSVQQAYWESCMYHCTYLREMKKSGCGGRPSVSGKIWGPDCPPLNLALLWSKKVKWAEWTVSWVQTIKWSVSREVVGAGMEQWAGVP